MDAWFIKGSDCLKQVEPPLEQLKPEHWAACHVAKAQVEEEKKEAALAPQPG